ncbi:MAG: alpha-hydroxy acid oxidase [Pseudomonadota bacterium]
MSDAPRSPAQLGGHPARHFYTGRDPTRAHGIDDLRARAHRLMPRFVLEYLEGGSEDEATLARERDAFADWRFVPRTLVNVSARTPAAPILGKSAPMPVIVAPTGLNGTFQRHADIALATGAARAGVPFVQSTMSNDTIEQVAAVAGLRHWFQLYVFGPDAIWHSLVDRAAAAGCEALVLTSNSQIFGNREWDARTRASETRPSFATIANAALHPRWAATTLSHGMPSFSNVIDFVPKDQRSFFQSAFWIRQQMPKSLSWDTVAKIRARWPGTFLLKGILNPEDVRLALHAGVDGVVLSSHGGRQMDWAVAPLDVLPRARDLVGDRIALMLSGGIRRGTDVLKAVALGADAVMAGRAPLYGLCAGGAAGVERALAILHKELCDAMGLLGVASLAELGPDLLQQARTS